MRYRDLKNERDEAVARALEAERLSMKSEFDRVTAEFEREKARLLAQVSEDVRDSYRRGFFDGLNAMADDVARRLKNRVSLGIACWRTEAPPAPDEIERAGWIRES